MTLLRKLTDLRRAAGAWAIAWAMTVIAGNRPPRRTTGPECTLHLGAGVHDGLAGQGLRKDLGDLRVERALDAALLPPEGRLAADEQEDHSGRECGGQPPLAHASTQR